MNGYTEVPVNAAYESIRTPNAPMTMKDTICDTTMQLNRARALLDDMWGFITDPCMEKHEMAKNGGDCMLGGMTCTLELATEIVASIERIAKVLGM